MRRAAPLFPFLREARADLPQEIHGVDRAGRGADQRRKVAGDAAAFHGGDARFFQPGGKGCERLVAI